MRIMRFQTPGHWKLVGSLGDIFSCKPSAHPDEVAVVARTQTDIERAHVEIPGSPGPPLRLAQDVEHLGCRVLRQAVGTFCSGTQDKTGCSI